uniref:Gamma-glutamylcyclotransferase n=1 Tax=Chloropicon laureae TaxID=464258 RepID=A0A7S2Z085_9CHLO
MMQQRAVVAVASGRADFELGRTNNFEEIQRKGEGEDGLVGVVGFGSLLSEKSAASTFSSVHRFRLGRVTNYRRIFSHVAPIFLERGIARVETKEMASLSVEPGTEKDSIVVSLFDIDVGDVAAFIAREEEYRFMAVKPDELNGTPGEHHHVMCLASCDEDFIANYGQERYDERYGKYGIERVWDDALLPCPVYLRHCVLAAEKMGTEAYDSFLDSTYLADRATTIRSYLDKRPDILDSLPPEHLRERYGG